MTRNAAGGPGGTRSRPPGSDVFVLAGDEVEEAA